VGEAENLSGREEKQKQKKKIMMSKNYTTWRNSKAGRGSEKRKKRRVGMRGHMRAPTPPTRREMHNRHTRDLNEKRDKRAQTNYPRPPFFLVSSYDSLAS